MSNSIALKKASNNNTSSDGEFPWFSDKHLTIHTNVAEAIVMSKDACGKNSSDADLLIATVFAQVFDIKPREMKCLIDGGSTHSFISPLSVADKYLKLINRYDSSLTFKDFEIQGATGTVTQNGQCFK